MKLWRNALQFGRQHIIERFDATKNPCAFQDISLLGQEQETSYRIYSRISRFGKSRFNLYSSPKKNYFFFASHSFHSFWLSMARAAWRPPATGCWCSTESPLLPPCLAADCLLTACRLSLLLLLVSVLLLGLVAAAFPTLPCC